MYLRTFQTIILMLAFLVGINFQVEAQDKKLPKCFFVTSYHKGYAWQDGVERGFRSVLEGKCEIRQFDMDTKRNTSPAFGQAKALEAKTLIEEWKPDILIAVDDNASKYLVAPHYKDAEIPVVFAGINWTAKEYGYPYSNATGMIEVEPIKPLVATLKKILPLAKDGVCIATSHLSAQKTARRLKEYAESTGIAMTIVNADTMDDFEDHYIAAQQADFILLRNNAVINDWDEVRARRITAEYSTKLTVTTNSWMTPYTMLAMTQVPEEQGEYAAEVALKILGGLKPQDIPVITNRRWHTYINMPLINKAGIRIPASLHHQGRRVE